MRCILLSILGLMITPVALAADRVTWIHLDLPPIFVVDGPFKGQGYGELIEAHLRNRLPEFDHQDTLLPLPRAVQAMKRQDGHCLISAKKYQEWSDDVIYSNQPVLPSMSNRLIIHSKDVSRFAAFRSQNGSINMQTLLKVRNFRLGFKPNGHYGGNLDQQLEASRNREEVFAVPNQTLLYEMFRLGRIDYFPGRVAEAAYYWKRKGHDVSFSALPIAGQPALTSRYLACSDGPIGRKLIESVNVELKQAGPYPAYLAHYESWIDPQSKEQFRALLSTQPPPADSDLPTS